VKECERVINARAALKESLIYENRSKMSRGRDT